MYTHIKQLVRRAALIGIIVPPTALAAMMLQLPADAIAGLGFDLLVQGAPSGEAVSVQMETPNGTHVGLRGTADTQGEATLRVDGRTVARAGTYAFSTKDGPTDTLAVLPDAFDPVLSTIDVWTPRIQDDGDDAASVTVTLRDQYGNPLPGRIAMLVSGRGNDDVASETNETDADGEQHFSVRTSEPGTITLRAIDLLSGVPLTDAATIRSGNDAAVGGREDRTSTSRMTNGNRFFYAQTASFDVIDGFDITLPSTMALGEEAAKITIRAVDRDGNTIEDYVGTVVFSSTDPTATLPNFGRYTFKERDLGKKDFPLVLTFKQAGEQTLRVEDENDRTIFGDATVTVTGDGSGATGKRITITSPKDGGAVNGTSIVVEGTGPAFSNLIVLGGATDTPGSSDADGHFAITVPLRPDQRDYTLRVQDEDRRYDSGPVLVHLDADIPTIGTITFNPQIPEEGEKVLVVLKSEPGLQAVVLTITQPSTNAVQEILLAPAATPGTYQAFFTAPGPGDYQPRFLVTDTAGNTAELRTTLKVGSPSLPVVTSVAAEPRVNAVAISWTEVEGDIDGYRVYVGKEAGSFEYFLDTKQPVGRATIAGLTPGKQYFLAVTALQGERESEKSSIVSAPALGISITVLPADEALQLQWTPVDADTPLSHFLLEYGLDEAHLTETRLLNRDLTTFTLSDLLNTVPYVLRLTPVTATGKKLTELSALAQGTPTGNGFHPGAGDPIPFDPTAHPAEQPTAAPTVPSVGIPDIAFVVALLAGIIGVWFILRRTAERNRTNAFLASLPHIR